MGIRVFENHEKLLAQGFHAVTVPAPLSWTAGQNIYDAWCQKNLQGEYDIRLYLGRKLTGFFRSDADAMLFALRWS
jgi:hypothetical protein